MKNAFQKILAILIAVILLGGGVMLINDGKNCLPSNDPPAVEQPPAETPPEETPPEDTPPEEKPEAATYTVNYVMYAENKLQAVLPFLYLEGGRYPTSYTEGETLTVDDLHGKMNKVTVNWGTGNPFEDETEEKPITMWAGSGVMDPNNPNKDYLVYGWYLDPDCTVEFVNGGAYLGNLTLYAKVSVGYWSDWY